MKKAGGVGCELCGTAARIYCESDRASLCWGCDHKVHGANFLVGKHSRSLLCHRCQSPTPWTASGPQIPPCMSLCLSCLALGSASSQQPQQPQQVAPPPPPTHHHHHNEEEEEEAEEEGYGSYSDSDDHDSDDDDEDDDENQVVPWTASSSPRSSAKTGISISSGSEADDTEDEEEDEDEDEDKEDNHGKTGLFSITSLKRKRETDFVHTSHRNTLPRL